MHMCGAAPNEKDLHSAAVLPCRFLGVSRKYPSDSFSFGDNGPIATSDLHVIARSGRHSAAWWSLVQHPMYKNTEALMLERSSDATAADVEGWWLTIADSPNATRDSTSVYMAVTVDMTKAAAVEAILSQV